MATRNASAPSIADAPPPRARASGLRSLLASLDRRLDEERDQLPLWLPVGLALGIAAWFFLPDEAAWTGWMALTAAAASLGFRSRERRSGRSIAIFSLAAMLGCALIWWKSIEVAAPRIERAAMVRLEARVEGLQPLPARAMVRLVVAPEGKSGPARLRLNVPEKMAPASLRIGTHVRFRAWMMPPPPMAAPGAFDFARQAWFQRLGGTGRALELEVLEARASSGFSARLAQWRSSLAAHVRSSVEGEGEAGIAAALATGDQHGIGEEDAEAMRRSGLAHLLSVSGLHLTAVVGAVMLLTLRLLALSPALALRLPLLLIASAAGAAAGLAYTLLTGAEVPTVRACIAALLVLVGIALGRDALTLRLVSVAALVVLLLWPETLAGPSFQLSFAAMIAIVSLHESRWARALLSRRDESLAGKCGRFLLGLVLTGLAVEIALAPIALFHFHKAGLYGAAANVVAIPLTTFVVMPLEALALLFDLVGLGGPFWWATGKTLSLLLGIAHRTAAAPGAVALLPALPPGAFLLLVGGGLWLALWRQGWRLWGLVPIAAGALWMVTSSAPHAIVTGDGRHLVLRTEEGLALLRPRAGDYVRDLLAELSGAEPVFVDLEDLPQARCSPELCAVNHRVQDRTWRILVTRSRDFVRWDRMVEACASADIVIADRRLPEACVPRWLKADRALLRRTGGLSLHLGSPARVETVAERQGAHPWAR